MKQPSIKTGFAPMVLVLVGLLVAVVGFAGWTVYQNSKDSSAVTTSTVTPAQTDSTSEVKSSADVDQNIKQLDSTELDGDLNTSELDADLNAML